MEECLYKRLKGINNFNEFSMYLLRWVGALMHGYVWEDIVSLYYTELLNGCIRDEVIMALHMH